MDTKLLRAFVMLSQERHFSRAADQLDIAQPVLSQQIKRLEEELGSPLFYREVRPIQMTPAGEVVLPFAVQILETEKLVRRAAVARDGSTLGTVSVGYAGASVNPLLPRMVAAVDRCAPGINLDLKPMVYAGKTQSLVRSGELDLAFSRRPLIEPGLDERVVEYEELIFAVPEKHPCAHYNEVKIVEFKDDPWIAFPASKGSAVREAGIRLAQQSGYTPRVVQEGPDSYAILGMVASGIGVTLTVSSVTHICPPGVKFVPIAGGSQYLVATLVFPRHPSAATRLVMDAFNEEFPTPPRPLGDVYE
ncbi:LysR family transcriptional regulator [Corynebacterium hadale]|uniref:LysR family transcriptional regulator n=1 Tax=Corynebacterium hadale TaxID=2026255 RepID=A0ABX4H9T2_9CORY|nr:LysR family transcriptional regulator [Corynebacterium hadale]PAT06087.1 LysR family transcriptional regulator [Corynebacterium hadale]